MLRLKVKDKVNVSNEKCTMGRVLFRILYHNNSQKIRDLDISWTFIHVEHGSGRVGIWYGDIIITLLECEE